MNYFTQENISNVINSKICIEEKLVKIWNLIGNFLQKSLFLKFKNHGISVGLEYDDFYTIAYLGYYDLISKCKNIEEVIKNKGFISFCKKRCSWYCSDYFRKFFTIKGKTLNSNNIISSPIETFDFIPYLITDVSDSEENMNRKIELERIFESINDFENFNISDNYNIKKFSNMIFNGFTRKEIIKKMEISDKDYRKMENIFKKRIKAFL